MKIYSAGKLNLQGNQEDKWEIIHGIFFYRTAHTLSKDVLWMPISGYWKSVDVTIATQEMSNNELLQTLIEITTYYPKFESTSNDVQQLHPYIKIKRIGLNTFNLYISKGTFKVSSKQVEIIMSNPDKFLKASCYFV